MTTADNAACLLNEHLRSPLVNAQAFRLFAMSNRERLTEQEIGRIQSYCGQIGQLTHDYDNELQIAITALEQGEGGSFGEINLSAQLEVQLDQCFLQKETILNEWARYEYETLHSGQLDHLVFFEDKEKSLEISRDGPTFLPHRMAAYKPCAFLEVGISKSHQASEMKVLWFEKLSQILRYVDALIQDEVVGAQRCPTSSRKRARDSKEKKSKGRNGIQDPLDSLALLGRVPSSSGPSSA
jgi:hypothetical protein